MKPSVPAWQTAGYLFVSVAGTLLHFVYDWTGGNLFAGLFSAVNESIWEHMKLIYYPMVLVALAEYRAWGREVPGFWCRKLTGLLTALLLIPVLYYTYTGIWGIRVDWLNIAIFFLAAGAAFLLETHSFQQGHPCVVSDGTAVALILLPAVFFTLFTFRTPRIPFFRDPVTGTYGMNG